MRIWVFFALLAVAQCGLFAQPNINTAVTSINGTVTPAVGTSISPGQGVTLKAYFQDVGTGVSYAFAAFETFPASVYGCKVGIQFGSPVNTSNIFLHDDNGNSLSPMWFGSGEQRSNSKCTLYASGSNAVPSGPNQYEVTWYLTFQDPYNGPKYVWLNGYDNNGYSTGWWYGNAAFTIFSQDYAPQTISVAPASGSNQPGVVQVFAYDVSDQNGGYTLPHSELVFGRGTSWLHGYDFYPTGPGPHPLSDTRCKIIQDQATVSLENDTQNGYVGSATIGSSQILSNSQCTVYASSFNVLPTSILGQRITLGVSFSPAFTGQLQDHIFAADNLGLYTWDTQGNGTWTWNVAQGTGSGSANSGGTPPPPQAPPTGSPDTTPPNTSTGSAQSCNDITGTWRDANNNQWTLVQNGASYTGQVVYPNPTSCGGTLTSQVSGYSTGPSSFSLMSSGPPNTDPCGNTIIHGSGTLDVLSCYSASYTSSNSASPGFMATPAAQPNSISWTRSTTPPTVQLTFDLYNNQANVTLSGPATQRGNLMISLVGPSTSIFASANGLGPGNYSYPANVQTLSTGQYSRVDASWGNTTLSVPVAFNIQGLTRFSTYNVSNESVCAGAATPVFVFDNDASCTYHYGSSMRADFTSFVRLNGTGLSSEFGLIKPYSITYLGRNLCNLPPGGSTANTFVKVNSVTGSCQNTLYSDKSLAVYPNPNGGGGPLTCSDKVLLMSSGGQAQSVRATQDLCPACSGDFRGTSGHIDAFSTTNQSCDPTTFTDLGNFISIRLR